MTVVKTNKAFFKARSHGLVVKADDSHPVGHEFEPQQAPYTRWMFC